MAQDNDLVTFIDDDPALPPDESRRRWKIIVIDDDEAVHDGTRFALYDYSLNGQRLEILSAYSAAEGRALLREHSDTAVVLLDVVMESDVAGLELVDYIRNELKNETVRIILRTGQPGQAPERRVIIDYDINDYKAKTELTADKLFTTLTAALRSYQQLQRLVETRRGLEIIIDAASTLFDFKSMQRLAEGVLTQIASLLNVDCAGILVLRESAGSADQAFSVLAGSGCYQQYIGQRGLDADLHKMVDAAFSRRRHEFHARRSVLYINTASGREVVVLIEAARHLSDTDRALVEVFCSKLSVAFDNVILYEELQKANAQLEERVAARTRALTLANERLATQGARLRRTNAFKGEILGTVAHDLKNPLSVIMGRAEMLKDMMSQSPVNAAVAREQISHVQESGRRLIDMVDTLLADAMADADDINLRRETFDITDMVRRVVEMNRELAVKKGQSLTLSAAPPLTVAADPDRLWEAVENLVNNAIKYTPAGGAVTLSVEPANGEAQIVVRDTGAGLSPEDVARLFGRFQRLSAKPTAGESSTGLGLSIVKRIVDLHGGQITAASPGAGKGATFTIALPLERSMP
jgi:signal transduction histidine kinase